MRVCSLKKAVFSFFFFGKKNCLSIKKELVCALEWLMLVTMKIAFGDLMSDFSLSLCLNCVLGVLFSQLTFVL